MNTAPKFPTFAEEMAARRALDLKVGGEQMPERVLLRDGGQTTVQAEEALVREFFNNVDTSSPAGRVHHMNAILAFNRIMERCRSALHA